MKRAIKIIACLLLAAGIAVFVYPHVQQGLYEKNVRTLIGKYDEWRQELQEDTKRAEHFAGEKEKAPYLPELYAAMQAYNLKLYENGQAGFQDAWSYQAPSFDLMKWGLPDNMAGYIHIPKMNVKLPVYLGATSENMKKGAVHLSQTSLPIGGVNTNCVIAAHRGYFGATLFRDIEALEAGDEITITNLWETMTYQVVELKVIRPCETSEVLIQKGRDLVTLITCHPYRHSYQRYVVYLERRER